MEHKTDHLFKKKLADMQTTPSPEAWERLQQNLSAGKKNKLPWRSWAAAVVLALCIAGFIIVRYGQQTGIKDPKNAQISMNVENAAPAAELNDNAEKSRLVNTQNADDDKALEEALPEAKVSERHADIAQNNSHKVAYVEEIPAGEHPEIENTAMDANIAKAPNNQSSEISTPERLEDDFIDEAPIPVLAQADQDVIASEASEENSASAKAPLNVTIVYKASENSALVRSEAKNIIGKGIEKIKQFSDDHVLTADRKTRLRNTKDELLALDFGKLLNKSNQGNDEK